MKDGKPDVDKITRTPDYFSDHCQMRVDELNLRSKIAGTNNTSDESPIVSMINVLGITIQPDTWDQYLWHTGLKNNIWTQKICSRNSKS